MRRSRNKILSAAGILLPLACIAVLSSCFMKESEKPASILFTGDLLLANAAEKYISQYGTDYPLALLDTEFTRYDLVCGNLESSITERGIEFENKLWRFRLNPRNAEYLERGRISVMTLANNHALDFGEQGMMDTIGFCRRAGIRTCGAGENLEQARAPVIMKVGDAAVAIFSRCERPPAEFYASADRPGTAPLDIAALKEDILRVRSQCDIVIVSVHWGVELSETVDGYLVDYAHAVIDAGADAVIGHHPHIPQGIEIYKGKPVFYSLGNTVCGFYNKKY
ncbi:MAG: CapA family protein, partial [Spirochaetota bacterium]